MCCKVSDLHNVCSAHTHTHTPNDVVPISSNLHECVYVEDEVEDAQI